jgi:lipopolysaccharide transport system ATP-binding protein
LTDEAGNLLSMPVRNDAEIWVRIEGIAEQTDPAMNIGYALSGEDGALIYWSLSTDGPETTWPESKRGKCVLSSRIPARFLNEGNYRLEMIISLHHRAWIAQPTVNAPSILLDIRGGLSDSPYWIMRRPGALGPELSWSVSYLGSESS